MADPELSADVAGPDPVVSELHYPLSYDVGERASVDKNTLIAKCVTS